MTTYTAEIISIGDELAIGKIIDTNSSWLSQQLTELGVRVLTHSTVGDEMEPIIEAIRLAATRADFVICSGGLGPTADDLTRQAMAELLKVPLIQDDEMLETIREMFKRRKYPMPESNKIQASLPQGTEFIPNRHGTAPGILATLVHDQKMVQIFAVPGVPVEMREMWYETIAEKIKNTIGVSNFIKTRTIHTFGQGESQVEQMLPNLISRDHYPRVGITASEATITLRIVAEEPTEEACDQAIESVAKIIYEKLGDLVYGENNDTLADVVCRKLNQERKTLATLEWGTGGLLAESLANARDFQSCIAAGLVIHNPEMLLHLFGFQPEYYALAHDFSPESQQQLAAITASELRERLMTDIALVIGPYPDHESVSGHDQEDANSVWIAVATAEGVELITFPYAWHPSLMNIITTKRALNFLRLRQ